MPHNIQSVTAYEQAREMVFHPTTYRGQRKSALIVLGAIAGGIVLCEGINWMFNRQKPWQIACIDTMKDSRDKARDPMDKLYVEEIVQAVTNTHATHIAIDTPYDQEFEERLQLWVQTARQNNLKVWFRGNFSSWEGWFGYPRNMGPAEHVQATKTFIESHIDLFQDGDIFTPAPEPENVLNVYDQKDALVSFLKNSYNACQEAFAKIPTSVNYGYYSMSADAALALASTQILQNTGNTIVIDHYVTTPEAMGSQIAQLHTQYPQTDIVIGEFGAPIEGINPDMSEHDQAVFIQKLIDQMESQHVKGVNYWVLFGGSTSLLHYDGRPKEAYYVIQKAYQRLGRR